MRRAKHLQEKSYYFHSQPNACGGTGPQCKYTLLTGACS